MSAGPIGQLHTKPMDFDELNPLLDDGYVHIELNCNDSKEMVNFCIQFEQNIWRSLHPSLYNGSGGTCVPTLGTKQIWILAGYGNERGLLENFQAPFEPKIVIKWADYQKK